MSWLQQSQLTPQQLNKFIKPTSSADLSECAIQYYNCNHLGTPQALIDTQGHIVWQSEYDPWGNQVEEKKPSNLYQPIRMPGQHYDEESGLHYNRYRYYDPKSGRYITQDPIGLLGGMNFYKYPLNPISHVDPLGIFVPIIIGGVYLSAEFVAVLITGTATVAFVASPAGQKAINTTSTVINESVVALTTSLAINCSAERAYCSNLCNKAKRDDDCKGRFGGRGGIWGGSFDACMRGCLPVECGGNPVK